MRGLMYLAASVFVLAACSKGSDDIAATYVSPAVYNEYTCSQIQQEIIRVNTQVNQMAGKLDDNRETDEAVTAAGIILFWPALFFLGGTKEEEAEFARLKGEFNALEQVSIQKDCAGLAKPKEG